MEIKSVLTIAGSDSIGGAGIQADIKTIFSLNAYAASCITAITAQNTMGVKNIQPVLPNILEDQIECVLTDLYIDAIKIGMIYNKENAEIIYKTLKKHKYDGFLVIDPVLVATSGNNLFKNNILETMKTYLFPIATIITPNIPEAEAICNKKIESKADMIAAAKEIINKYNAKNVLIKGGHNVSEDMTDILVLSNKNYYEYSAPKIDSKNTHGTGCTLSSAIATYLAKGYHLQESVKKAKEYVYQAILASKDLVLGNEHGSTNHAWMNIKKE